MKSNQMTWTLKSDILHGNQCHYPHELGNKTTDPENSVRVLDYTRITLIENETAQPDFTGRDILSKHTTLG